MYKILLKKFDKKKANIFFKLLFLVWKLIEIEVMR